MSQDIEIWKEAYPAPLTGETGTETSLRIAVRIPECWSDVGRFLCLSQLFNDDISTLFAEKTSPAPAESYLVSRDLAAGPAPNLHVPGVEVRILLQCWLVEENVSLISWRARRNQNVALPELRVT